MAGNHGLQSGPPGPTPQSYHISGTCRIVSQHEPARGGTGTQANKQYPQQEYPHQQPRYPQSQQPRYPQSQQPRYPQSQQPQEWRGRNKLGNRRAQRIMPPPSRPRQSSQTQDSSGIETGFDDNYPYDDSASDTEAYDPSSRQLVPASGQAQQMMSSAPPDPQGSSSSSSPETTGQSQQPSTVVATYPVPVAVPTPVYVSPPTVTTRIIYPTVTYPTYPYPYYYYPRPVCAGPVYHYPTMF